MAEPPRDLESILAALAAQRPPTSTPTQTQPGVPVPSYATPPNAYSNMPPGVQPPYQAPASYQYPQPTSSGALDLSAIKPVNSGTVSIQDAIAKAKAFAVNNNVTPYDRPAQYGGNDPRGTDADRYQNSRSRSPQRRDAFRDNFNPYRDERRDERGGRGADYSHSRDRSFSPRGRDRAGETFSPRGANGSGRDRSPLRGGDNAEIIQIESSLVGLIIGRQGENMRRIEQDSHCRVQFLPQQPGADDQYRQCKITGPPARRAQAKAAINSIIEDNGMGAIARGAHTAARGGFGGGPPSGPPQLRDGEETMQIMIPDRTVGLIIGRGGETIKDLQERSKCHINIVGESKSVNGLRPVNLVGSAAATAHAKDLIMEIVDSDSRNMNSGGAGGGGSGGGGASSNPPPRHGHRDGGGAGGPGGPGGPDKINDAIHVPSEAVGMIIGKGGETIREMQNATGCKINVSQSSGPGEVEREIGLVGSRDAINRAKRAIEDKVEAVRQKNSGGGGGGGGGGRGRHREYDNPNYGQSNHNSAAHNNPPAVQASAGGDQDPYAAYGGYNAYVAMWYSALAQQQQSGQMPGDAAKPPGTS